MKGKVWPGECNFQTILILKLENGGLDYLKLISDIGVKEFGMI
jgi:hypothetical protein